MYLPLETLTFIIRTRLPILVELIDLVNSYNFSISNDLTQMVNFPLMLVVVLQWLYLHWEILIMLLSQFSYSQQDALFYCIAYDYFYMDWHGLNGHLRDVSWEDIFKCFCCC